MRSGASHPGPHRACVPDQPLSPRRRRNDRFSPTAPARGCHICRSQLSTRCRATADPQPCGGQRPVLMLQGARRGRRPQRPDNQSRKRGLWKFPPAFPVENRRLPLALPQSSGPAKNSHVSLNTLSIRLLRLATQKAHPLVQKLWTMRLPCGRPRKSKPEV